VGGRIKAAAARADTNHKITNIIDKPMTQNKGPYIKDLQDGQAVAGLFLIKELSRAETKNGKPYLILTAIDRTGEIGGRVWDNADQVMAECAAGRIVALTGQAQAYKGILQLKIETAQAVDSGLVDMADFQPTAPGDIKQMAGQLLALARSIREPDLRKLTRKFFEDEGFFSIFIKAPAAKNMHHAYLGGLLEHTLSVARLADLVASLYAGLDRDLLLTGALLHDVGKTEEFAFDSLPFNYTDKGRLVGHLVLGAEMVRARADKLKNFPEDLLVRVQHLILSHHGQYEFGSPCLPMLTEAFALNFLDDLDAKINYISRLEMRLDQTGGYQWTDYQKMLERFLFLRGRNDQEQNAQTDNPADNTTAATPGTAAAKETRQQTLFRLP